MMIIQALQQTAALKRNCEFKVTEAAAAERSRSAAQRRPTPIRGQGGGLRLRTRRSACHTRRGLSMSDSSPGSARAGRALVYSLAGFALAVVILWGAISG